MFDSDEEFDARVAKGPSQAMTDFLETLPSSLRESAVPLSLFTKAGFLANGSFGKRFNNCAASNEILVYLRTHLRLIV